MVNKKSSLPRRAPAVRTLGWLVVVLMLAMAVIPSVVSAADGDVTIVQDDNTNGCNGVRTTPGSENTDKQLIGGSLEPGGTARFLITYPVDPEDVAGREEFEITDCVFIEDTAVLKFFISFVPNTTDFELELTLNIPPDAPLGAEICNFAKTTAAPSNSQASNRKAGPACFIVGGSLRVEKVDGNGDPLAGADFDIDCTWPTTSSFLSDTIINVDGDTETINSVSGGSFHREVTTGSDGVISVQAPVGTECTFTETSAPGGFELPGDTTCTLTVQLGEQGECTFVNEATPDPDADTHPDANPDTDTNTDARRSTSSRPRACPAMTCPACRSSATCSACRS